jgi:hypothetical protein
MANRKPISRNELQWRLREDLFLSDYEIAEDIFTSNFVAEKIQNCKLAKLHIKNETLRIPKVEFIDCDITELIFEVVTGVELTISGGSYVAIDIKTDDITTHNSITNLKLENLNSPFKLNISDLKSKAIVITKCKLTNFQFNDCETEKLSITQTDVTENLTWGNSRVTENMIFATSSLTNGEIKNSHLNKLMVVSSVLKKELTLESGECEYFSISGQSDLNKIEFKNIALREFIMFQGKVKELLFNPMELRKVTISHEGIGMVSIEKFELNAFFMNTAPPAISIKDLQAHEFTIKNFRNGESFRLMDSEIKHTFNLDFCNLRPSDSSISEISNLDLQSCRKISFFKTNILDTEFYNVRWNANYRLDKKEKEIKGLTTAKKINHFWIIKESYRQLKIVSIANSNKIDANFFQSGELDIYYEILWRKALVYRQHVGDFFILLISRVFGGYGLNIWRPILWWAFLHSALFAVIVRYARLPFQFAETSNTIDWSTTKKAATLYFSLLSPVHETNFWNHNIFGLSDILIRIVAGFFIYYIIRASRKFIFSP